MLNVEEENYCEDIYLEGYVKQVGEEFDFVFFFRY